MKRIILAMSVATAVCAAPAAVSADETNPNIVHRQGIFKIAAGHMTALKSIVGLNFEAARGHIGYHATGLKEAFQHHHDPFPPGTDKGETKARPEIWTKNDDFRAAGKRATEAVDKLVEASKGTDMKVVAAAFKDVGAACKNCHDSFRKE